MKKLSIVFLALCTSSFFVLSSQAEDSSGKVAIEDFVKQLHVEGVTRAAVAAYDSSDVSTLIELLDNDDFEEYQPNILATLGILGTPEAVDTLIAFTQSAPLNPDSPDPFYAQDVAMISLGYTGSPVALDFLTQGLYSANSGKVNSFALTEAQQRRIGDIQQSAIHGLTLLGTQAAAEVLYNFKSTSKNLNKSLSNLVDSALEENALIQAIGVDAYDELRPEQ